MHSVLGSLLRSWVRHSHSTPIQPGGKLQPWTKELVRLQVYSSSLPPPCSMLTSPTYFTGNRYPWRVQY